MSYYFYIWVRNLSTFCGFFCFRRLYSVEYCFFKLRSAVGIDVTSTRVQTGNHFFPLGGENGICPNCWTSADEEGVCCEGGGNWDTGTNEHGIVWSFSSWEFSLSGAESDAVASYSCFWWQGFPFAIQRLYCFSKRGSRRSSGNVERSRGQIPVALKPALTCPMLSLHATLQLSCWRMHVCWLAY